MTPEQRHKNMAAIHSRDTKPEMMVRKFLWEHGYRYRLNHPRLPGRPDIVMRKYRTCIFVNGCFWHGHQVTYCDVKSEELKVNSVGCESNLQVSSSMCCKIPKTRTEFWVNKILKNKERDKRVQHELARMGWHCITIWECQLKPQFRMQTLDSLAYTLNKIYLSDHGVKKYVTEEPEIGMVAEDNA